MGTLIFPLMMLYSVPLLAQEPGTTYDYPDHAGSFASRTDYVEALQLPETVKRSLSEGRLLL